MLIVLALFLTILFRRYYNAHALRNGLFYDLITVVTLVSEKILRRDSLNQGASLFTIIDGTRCDNNSDRHTMRIHGQMYLGIEPPFVRSMS